MTNSTINLVSCLRGEGDAKAFLESTGSDKGASRMVSERTMSTILLNIIKLL